MANTSAIHSVGESIVTFLRKRYPQELSDRYSADFQLLASGQLAAEPDFDETQVVITLFLYLVTISEHLRNARPPANPGGAVPLTLNLHYLLSVWSNSAAAEQTVLGWTLRELHRHPILDASSLEPSGGWAADEVIHIVPSELSTEDLMRIWDAIVPSYRLSCAYTARVVRIDADLDAGPPPVLATRLALGER
ncbi:DUF4255 domain-containing protein [Sorangium sp. So ce1024]|uniref:DUF4255 domain-containing protein n=1 Tax=unclassified Sorangium TaxID=2621164 RepID=UPI003EFE5E0B